MDGVKVVTSGNVDLQKALCALCRKPMSEHVTKDSGFQCPDGGPTMAHPLRRKDDVVTFVPLTDVIASEETPEQTETPAKRSARRARKGASKRTKRSTKGRRESRVKEQDEPKRSRGRIAGVYIPGDKEPTKLTESIERVYKTVRAHKRGISQKDIAAKLDMSPGTVGWGLQKLRKQKAVSYSPTEA